MNEIKSLSVEFITKDGIQLNGLSNIVEKLEIHYLVYKITNNINGKYYIGQHKTTDPYDSYMGSGNLIKAVCNKYQCSCFIKQILFDFDNFNDMNNKEKELVPLSACYPYNPMSYNICEGGNNGIKNPESIKRGVKHYKETLRSLPKEVLQERNIRRGKSIKKYWETHPEEAYRKGGKLKTKNVSKTKEHNLKNSIAHKGKKFSKEHCQHLKENHYDVRGSNNPAFGRKWMQNTSTLDIVYAKQDEIETYLNMGYIFGTRLVKNAIIDPNKKNERLINTKLAAYKKYLNRSMLQILFYLIITNTLNQYKRTI